MKWLPPRRHWIPQFTTPLAPPPAQIFCFIYGSDDEGSFACSAYISGARFAVYQRDAGATGTGDCPPHTLGSGGDNLAKSYAILKATPLTLFNVEHRLKP